MSETSRASLIIINPPLSQTLVKFPRMWEWCEVGFTTSVKPKDQLGVFPRCQHSDRNQEKLSQPPWGAKPEDRLLSSSQWNWGRPGAPCRQGAAAVLGKGSCQTCAPARTPDHTVLEAVEGSGQAQWQLLDPRIQVQVQIQTRCACGLCERVQILCVCANYKGLDFLTFLNPSTTLSFWEKSERRRALSYAHIQQKSWQEL